MNFELFKKWEHSIKLLKCYKCLDVTDIFPKRKLRYDLCFTCYCKNPFCNASWYICPIHNKRFSKSKMSRVNEHFLGKDHEAGCIIDDSILLTMEESTAIEPSSTKCNDSLLLNSENVLVEDPSQRQNSSKRSKLIHDSADGSNEKNILESLLHPKSKIFLTET